MPHGLAQSIGAGPSAVLLPVAGGVVDAVGSAPVDELPSAGVLAAAGQSVLEEGAVEAGESEDGGGVVTGQVMAAHFQESQAPFVGPLLVPVAQDEEDEHQPQVWVLVQAPQSV